MPISTKLTRALGIRHPLVQGGMHYVGYAELVAAVGNAGAIGCITALTQPSPELLQREIRQVQLLHTIPTSQLNIQLVFLSRTRVISPCYNVCCLAGSARS